MPYVERSSLRGVSGLHSALRMPSSLVLEGYIGRLIWQAMWCRSIRPVAKLKILSLLNFCMEGRCLCGTAFSGIESLMLSGICCINAIDMPRLRTLDIDEQHGEWKLTGNTAPEEISFTGGTITAMDVRNIYRWVRSPNAKTLRIGPNAKFNDDGMLHFNFFLGREVEKQCPEERIYPVKLLVPREPTKWSDFQATHLPVPSISGA